MGIIIKNGIQYGNQPDTYTKTKIKALLTSQIESSNIASNNHLIDSYFLYNDTLYITIDNISIGDTIIPETNCLSTTIYDELTKINNFIDSLENANEINY